MEKIGPVIADITSTCKKCYKKVLLLKSEPGPYREGYPAWHYPCERPVRSHSRNIKAGPIPSYPSSRVSSHFSLETFRVFKSGFLCSFVLQGSEEESLLSFLSMFLLKSQSLVILFIPFIFLYIYSSHLYSKLKGTRQFYLFL